MLVDDVAGNVLGRYCSPSHRMLAIPKDLAAAAAGGGGAEGAGEEEASAVARATGEEEGERISRGVLARMSGRYPERKVPALTCTHM